jgi:dual specificity tyrosine-phosphorylation-regulated kinase 2/3/4
VKIIDFGTSAWKDNAAYTYIQTRYYRAPEVILAGKLSQAVDI